MAISPELLVHREWLGQIGQVGLVVSPNVLVKQGIAIDKTRALQAQTRIGELAAAGGDDAEPRIRDAVVFFREALGWPESIIAGAPGGPALPTDLVATLPEYEDHIRPTYAISDPAGPGWLALIQVTDAEDLDKAPATDAKHDGWHASPHARLERLLRAADVSIGLLFNSRSLRLVYAPRGESSGHLTFRFKYLLETQGRPMAGALCAMLDAERVTDVAQESQRLLALLKESRKSQNDVSTALAGQVLEALWELVRGFQHANEATKGQLLEEVMRERPAEVYGGLLTTLMRLVFILYAEDRGLMPGGEVYQRHYSLAGLFERLREDQARYPDTMDARFGAWAQLLALFRLIHDGGGHGGLRFPPRHGRLFSPDAYPFLEGRLAGTTRVMREPVTPPQISDGVVFRVLRNLLILDGDRLSYRTLDVEQIGSVYEAMMGFALEQAAGPSLALQPKHIVINLDDLLEQAGGDRAKWLREHAELTLSSAGALGKASTRDELVAALGKRVSRYTAQVLRVGALYLQPTEERRRSGSHYTPRSLTEPIVRTTFRPIFERLGEKATPEQILDLKVCDPAMGSGAFLVEACRLLADRLVRAWEVHRRTPTVPPDEDVWTFARRLVAERCLYGVDKNIFAVDLAKLSLWLATLAREHPFTFLDHALRHGDSLVGLSREQIACFNWEVEKQMPLLRSLIDRRVAEAQRLREQIQGLADSDDVPRKSHLLQDAEDSLADVRLIGDLVIESFFAREKPKERKTLRTAYAGNAEAWLGPDAAVAARRHEEMFTTASGLREGPKPIPPFHWEIEFPEVFTRTNVGFDVFVGNPPFAGKNTLAASTRDHYPVWLQTLHPESHGNADLVAHFYRRSFKLLRYGGTFGLIATNTIAQGDTRGTGLRWIRKHDGVIFSARKRIRWPGQAAVVVSVVHVCKGPLSGPFDLDGRKTEVITAFLFHTGGDDDPAPLAENAGKSFQGSVVLGMGFTFDDTDKKGVANPISLMHELIRKNPRNAERIFPYIGGEEVNDSPAHLHHRYVINFDQMPEDECRRNWPDLMAIVEAKVRPEREKQADAGARKCWWQFIRPRPELYEAIRPLDRVLVIARVSETAAFTFLPSRQVLHEKLVVFASKSPAMFCVLQSRIHESWARWLNSTLKEDMQYTPSDCFETYPFPTGWAANERLEAAGLAYFEFRANLMIQNDQGLTDTYSRFHDRDEHDVGILQLRDLHDAMDRAVCEAYGFNRLDLTCDFLPIGDIPDGEGASSQEEPKLRYRWPDVTRDAVLAALLDENRQRAAAESAVVTAQPTVGARAGRRRRLRPGANTPLFGQ